MSQTEMLVRVKVGDSSRNGKGDYLEFPGFHNPWLSLRQTLESYLVPAEGERFPRESPVYDLEDLYYTTLFAAWHLLRSGFTSVAIILDGNFILPSGLETVAQALQDIGLPGWVGNLVDLEEQDKATHLALQENFDFFRQQKFHPVRGVWAIRGCGNSGGKLWKELFRERIVVDRLYVFRWRETDRKEGFPFWQKGCRAIFSDTESFPAISRKGSRVPLFTLFESEQNFPGSGEEAEKGVLAISLTRDRIVSPNYSYFLSTAGFWKSQSTVYRFPEIFFPFPGLSRKYLLSRFPEMMDQMRDARIIVHNVSLNRQQIIKNQKLTRISEAVIQHEFEHVLRKLNRN